MAGRRRQPESAAGSAEGVEQEAKKKPLAPGQCRAFMRRTLAEEFPGIVDGFVKQAKRGSCQHVKLATELLEPRRRQKRVDDGRAVLESWVKELRQER